MIKIGLTGGIGSGKSTVAKMFEQLNVPVYYADVEAKKLMLTSKFIKKKLIKRFGKEVYIKNNLNKPFLANLIFTNTDNLKYVNSVVHPKVNQHFKKWIKKQEVLNEYNYVIQENAILFENETNLLFDYIITVTASVKLKIDRVIKRDNTTKDKVLERMNNQWTDEEKIEKSDFTIENILLKETLTQVKKIHKLILMRIDSK
ncbi:MAG: dephospho-CoA kinase [Flavobacteriaceae bacterium]